MNNKKGFTLVEVLVSLALVSVIAIFLFQIIFIVRDIYSEKNIKSEIYIESANISNVINKDILDKEKNGVYIKTINKVSNDELYIVYSDGIKSNIIIDRENNTITYGNYTVSILNVAKIGNIELFYNYENNNMVKNGICYIKIPITHEDYNNDFGVIITYRYDSSKTRVNGNVSIRPGINDNVCNVAANTSWTFDYTGNVQDFLTPCAGTYKIELWGAQGGGNNANIKGGLGAYTSGYLDLENSEMLYLYVGGIGSETSAGTEQSIAGGYNGGGITGGQACCGRIFGSGGGATDVRLANGTWNDFNSLKSRIMVAAGGGGGFLQDYSAGTNYNDGGSAGGLNGYKGDQAWSYCYGEGGTQNSGGIITTDCTHSSEQGGGTVTGGFGTGGGKSWGSTGAGSGYYGGSRSGHIASSGGGSSFISGYSGCNAISKDSTQSNIKHTNQPNHYSGKIFKDSIMIDGKGCNWATGEATNCGNNQPQPNGTLAAGHSGNGYAKITYIGQNVSTSHNTNIGQVWDLSYTGDVQEFVAPDSGTYKLEVWGAQGGNVADSTPAAIGGYGGYSVGTVNLTRTEKVYVFVGQQGQQTYNNSTISNDVDVYTYPNGGVVRSKRDPSNYTITYNGGGGSTHIARRNKLIAELTPGSSDLLIVAGGGGGVCNWWSSANGDGGSAGGYIGNSTTVNYQNTNAVGGTQSEGGAGGGNTTASAAAGRYGYGGGSNFANTSNLSGAGGGGYYGGGASWGGSGAGGSGYIGNSSLSNKKMVCYNCATDDHTATKTETTTCHNANPVADCAKEGNGYARITLISH